MANIDRTFSLKHKWGQIQTKTDLTRLIKKTFKPRDIRKGRPRFIKVWYHFFIFNLGLLFTLLWLQIMNATD